MAPAPIMLADEPLSPGQAAVKWSCTRRGRYLLLSAVFAVVFLGLAGARNSETLASQYHSISNYRWRPDYPTTIHTPLEPPSNTTLQLENGEIEQIPPALKKSTPNFHLLMPAEDDSEDFCKTTLSAMLLNYPPPTAINFHQPFDTPVDKERHTLASIRDYLSDESMVHDHDLVLIVDGHETWFQLPSEVMVKQYEQIIEEANMRLLRKYGKNDDGWQMFNQTIVFGAEKVCHGNEEACKDAPESPLPYNAYSTKDSGEIQDMPAKYLNSKVAMGPAKDLRMLYSEAHRIFEKQKSEKRTGQSVLASIFSDQQTHRKSAQKTQSAASRLQAWLHSLKPASQPAPNPRRATPPKPNLTLRKEKTYEFALGLDYTHTLFQPTNSLAPTELIPQSPTNTSGTTLVPLPSSLLTSNPPYWIPSSAPSTPHQDHSPHITALSHNAKLDVLPAATTPWTALPILQNTITASTPATLQRNKHTTPWITMWYHPHVRALLREALRAPQSARGYHESAVGGDRGWDVRGGRGGVWSFSGGSEAASSWWMPWGEVDGVCGGIGVMRGVFGDGRGVWLHEGEERNEEAREKDIDEYWIGVAVKAKEKEEREKKANEGKLERRWVG